MPPTAVMSGSAAVWPPSEQYLRAGLIDDLHLAIVPTLLGSGEQLFDDSWAGYEFVSSLAVAHVRFVRAATEV